jgi:hypothetical protein
LSRLFELGERPLSPDNPFSLEGNCGAMTPTIGGREGALSDLVFFRKTGIHRSQAGAWFLRIML